MKHDELAYECRMNACACESACALSVCAPIDVCEMNVFYIKLGLLEMEVSDAGDENEYHTYHRQHRNGKLIRMYMYIVQRTYIASLFN